MAAAPAADKPVKQTARHTRSPHLNAPTFCYGARFIRCQRGQIRTGVSVCQRSFVGTNNFHIPSFIPRHCAGYYQQTYLTKVTTHFRWTSTSTVYFPNVTFIATMRPTRSKMTNYVCKKRPQPTLLFKCRH